MGELGWAVLHPIKEGSPRRALGHDELLVGVEPAHVFRLRAPEHPVDDVGNADAGCERQGDSSLAEAASERLQRAAISITRRLGVGVGVSELGHNVLTCGK